MPSHILQEPWSRSLEADEYNPIKKQIGVVMGIGIVIGIMIQRNITRDILPSEEYLYMSSFWEFCFHLECKKLERAWSKPTNKKLDGLPIITSLEPSESCN